MNQNASSNSHACEYCESTNTRVLASIDFNSDGAVLAVLVGCCDCDRAFVVELDGPTESSSDC